MAINHTNLSESNIVDIDGDKIVVIVSQPGFIKLESGSSMPANDYTPDGDLEQLGENRSQVKGSTIIIITVLLMMITLPATFQLVQVIRSKPILEEE
jgi:hypothetical protein